MSYNNSFSLSILFSLLYFPILESADPTVANSCHMYCGEMHIPFPFGIGMGCYLEKQYEIECIPISGKLVPFLSLINKEVVSISLPSVYNQECGGSIRIKTSVTSKGCSSEKEESRSLLNLTDTPFYVGFSNTLVGVGCNNTVSLTNVEPNMVGCRSSCSTPNHTASKDYFKTIACHNEALLYGLEINNCSEVHETNCNGIGCCKASMPKEVHQVVGVKIDDSTTTGNCKIAFLTVDQPYEMSNGYTLQQLHARRYSIVELRWLIHTTNLSFVGSLGCQNTTEKIYDPRRRCVCDYNGVVNFGSCACNRGYKGNPYNHTGCEDIDECIEINSYGGRCGIGYICVNLQGDYECVFPKIRRIAIGVGVGFGSLILVGGVFWLYKFIIKQRRLNQKKKFFKRNGCLLLQQQLNSTEGNVEKTKVFSSRELEKATENFSFNRILGQGGQGTVYKGMLVDGRIVAVKKSKVVDEDKLEEFINEVVILSQKNVLILLYEFISNGNLFEHLHDEFDDSMMTTWEVRLRIAVDIAGALSYLHSAASSPIYHRDVKSTNIMLDEKYLAKVSDFGTSRTVTVDHTHLTTVVSGTVGYMDPEYFQSSQFTDKSDVYSFGVVLVELITGEKSISFMRSLENRALATYFITKLKENKLFEIIDARIRDGCKLDQVIATAKLARRCLNLKGKKRPNMREVSMELEKIRSTLMDMQPYEYASESEEENEEKIMEVNIGVESWNNVVVTASGSPYTVDPLSLLCSDVEPLFPLETR